MFKLWQQRSKAKAERVQMREEVQLQKGLGRCTLVPAVIC